MENSNFKNEQKRYAAQTAYESLMSRALNYSGNVYDPKKYNQVCMYRAVSHSMLYNIFKVKNPDKSFTKLKSCLTGGLNKISKQKITIESRKRIMELIPMIQSFTYLSQIDEIVSEVLELINPSID